jgi:hypothetical protein
MEQIERAVLDAAVEGVNLWPGTLRDQIGTEATLLHFLRSFG